ncbi:MAG: 3D domain-containing protein [Candidatus Marinimicrobia bacterium]|nr:3D domain-containing protein [Candidatus Neomarinimicrobiota bacterium]
MTKKQKYKLLRQRIYLIMIIILVIPFTNGCAVFQNQLRPHFTRIPRIVTLQVTAYCACDKCCGWKYNSMGERVYAYGPQKGKPKLIGLTASGAMAKRGTIAADNSLFPVGTIMYVEGYGYGRVEDRGSSIVGEHIDVFFKNHERAMHWGNRTMKVKVWLPK